MAKRIAIDLPGYVRHTPKHPDGFTPYMGEHGEREILRTTESLRDMQNMMNAGTDDPLGDAWFDSDELPNHVRVLEEAEFFETYMM